MKLIFPDYGISRVLTDPEVSMERKSSLKYLGEIYLKDSHTINGLRRFLKNTGLT